MSWTREIGSLRQELREYAESLVARCFVWTFTANTSALGKQDQVETGDDDSNKGQRPVRRVEPFGLRSRVPAKQRSLSLRLGSSTVLYLGVASDGGYGPGDLADGELAIYSKNVPKALHAMDNGDVALASKAGQVVSVNGTDYVLPKWDVFYADFVTWVTTLNTFIGTVVPVTGATGGPAYATAIALPTSLIPKMAVPSNYKSAKAKNG